MRICIYSVWDNKVLKTGWIKGGYDIKYQWSRINKPPVEGVPYWDWYFEMSFKYDFKANSDKIYFSYSVPFTYS